MVEPNGHQETSEVPARPPRTAGLEEGLGLGSGGGNGFGFNAIMELARGSIKPEEWMVRTPWDERMIVIHNLDVAAKQECMNGNTDTDLIWWLRGHQMQGLGGKRVQQIVDMVIATTNRQPPQRQTSAFEQTNGINPTPPTVR